MKLQTNSKLSFRRNERGTMRDEVVAANHLISLLLARTRIYLSTHLDAPRTASSQCLLDDADIATTVRDAISCVAAVPDGALQVSVENGWVTLRGNLGTWAQRETIERITLQSVGVRGVVNSMTVDENPIPSYENQ